MSKLVYATIAINKLSFSIFVAHTNHSHLILSLSSFISNRRGQTSKGAKLSPRFCPLCEKMQGGIERPWRILAGFGTHDHICNQAYDN